MLSLVAHYGYIVLFSALLLELVAVPLPGELLMSYAGFLVFQGRLNWAVCILAAGLGASFGITISFFAGSKLGPPFINRYGRYFHLGPERVSAFSDSFSKYGKSFLILAYFIPGVRHITGYFAGVTKIPYYKFAIYAYTGAFLWAGTFISLGKVLGPKWGIFHSSIRKWLIIAGIVGAVILTLVYIYRKNKQTIVEKTTVTLNNAYNRFKSFRRIKVLIITTTVTLFGLVLLMFGLIQDYLSSEFGLFNEITTLLVHIIFSQIWYSWMKFFAIIATVKILIPVALTSGVWVMVKGKEKMLELLFLLIAVLTGKALDMILPVVFHRFGPIAASNFPSGQTFFPVVILGFSAFLFLRHGQNLFLRFAVPGLTLMTLLSIGISKLYFNQQNPSDIVGGYVFGGLWVCLNILLLEIFRILEKENFWKVSIESK